jgi:hypothetical protein
MNGFHEVCLPVAIYPSRLIKKALRNEKERMMKVVSSSVKRRGSDHGIENADRRRCTK